MRDRALEEDDQVGGVRADVEQADAQFALIGGERGFGGGDGLEHRFGHFKAGAVGAGDGALQRAAGAGGDVQIDFEPRADHAHGVKDAGLVVDDELARQQVQDFAVGRALDGAGAFHGGAHVFAGDLAHAAAEFKAAVGVEPEDMRAAYAHDALIDVGAGHPLRLLVGRLDRFCGRTEFGDETLAHARRLHHRVAAIAQGALVQVQPRARASRRCRCRAPRSDCPVSGSSYAAHWPWPFPAAGRGGVG